MMDAPLADGWDTVMKYAEDVERTMKQFYESLSEKDKRAYAAVEVAKLGHGGTEYIAQVLGCDPKTIRRGRHDLVQPPEVSPGKVRRPGGGRKKNLRRPDNAR